MINLELGKLEANLIDTLEVETAVFICLFNHLSYILEKH